MQLIAMQTAREKSSPYTLPYTKGLRVTGVQIARTDCNISSVKNQGEGRLQVGRKVGRHLQREYCKGSSIWTSSEGDIKRLVSSHEI